MTRPRPWKRLLPLAGLACASLILEGGARLLYHVDAVFLSRAEHDVPWRRVWVQRHEAGTEIHYSFDLFDPARGWALKPGLHGLNAFGGEVLALSSNSDGMRGLREYPIPKPAGRTRILILGDSFTFGEEVSDDETYPAALQKLLPSAEVLNLGVHGYGNDQMLIDLKERGLKYRPDVVVLGFVEADMIRNVLPFRDYAKPRFVLEGGRLKLEGSPVPRPEDELRAEFFRSKFLDLLRLLAHDMDPAGQEREIDAVTAAVLDETRRAVESSGARFVLADLPTQTDRLAARQEDRFFLDYCRTSGTDCLDLRAYAGKRIDEGRPFGFRPYAHWDPDAHRLIAEGLRDGLTRKPPTPGK